MGLSISAVWARWAVLMLLAGSMTAYAVPVATRASSSGGVGSGPLVINKPAGTTTGDVMVASVGYRPCSSTSGGGCTTSINAPAGWTLVRLVEQTTGGGTGGYGLRLAIYRKVVTAAESAITSYSWTFSGSPTHNGAAGAISSFQNVDLTNPIVIDAGQTTPSSTSHSTPDLGVLATNTMLVSTHAALSSANWTPPAGMTEIQDWASMTVPDALGMSLEINNEQRPAPGQTGIRTATFSSPAPAGDAGATHVLALRPIQADPTIAMSANSLLGVLTSYDLTVGNLGPQPISAANISVKDTLPAGLSYNGYSGTGWTCSAVGQVVTCTYSGSALASGGSLPVLNIKVNVTSGTQWTNTATVSSGADGDNDLTNSTATNTWPTVTTTITTGNASCTDPAAATIGPSAAATDVDCFTLQTNSATEAITAIVVNLSSNLGVDTIAVTDTSNTVLGSVTNPASGSVTIPVISLTATTTVKALKIRITPLVHVTMPVPPGGTYTINAPVTAWTGPALHLGTDTDVNALSIDNQSPNAATAVSGTAGTQKVTLNWTTSSSTDYATTKGTVIYRWVGAPAGTEVPIEGSTPLVGEVNGTATVACVSSSARSTAVSAVDGSGGTAGVCTTTALTNGQVYTYKIFQKDALGNYDTGTLIGSFGAATPSSFNAFETTTSAGSITGQIYTELAGTSYSLDLVAVSSGAVLSSFTNSVTVDLIANNTTGVALGANNCPTSGTVLSVGTATISAGRSTVTFPAVTNAWRDVRVRISYPTVSPTVVACSNDNFAIRPAGFTVSSSNANADNTGASVSATPVVKTSANFSLTADTSTAGYNGTPVLDATKAAAHVGAVQVGTLAGTFGAANGATGNGATGSTFTYKEVGYFRLAADGVVDSSFTSVDSAGDCIANSSSNVLSGGKYGCNIANQAATNYFGRFIPDHFDVAIAQNGALQTACGSNFTYTGQAMSYQAASLPTLTIKPMNAASSGAVTKNYVNTWQKLTASGITITAPTADTTTNGLDAVTKMALVAAMSAGTLTNDGAGTLTYKLSASDSFTYTRNANSLVVPFTSAISLVTTAVAEPAADSVNGTTSLGGLPTLTPTGAQIRYGRLRLQNAYGSELLPLAVSMEPQYWNGSWQKNTLDTCSTITAAQFAWSFPAGTSARPNNLAACESAVTVSGTPPNQTVSLSKPGASNAGWADLTLNLGSTASGNQCTAVGGAGGASTTANMPWLQFNWSGSLGNPTSRATFGTYTSPLIYRRENY